MMKKLFILMSLGLASAAMAQDWQPFPYDSVYFMNPDNDKDILVPVVKSPVPGQLLLEMSTNAERSIINRHIDGDLSAPFTSPTAHWFGDNMVYNSGVLKLNSLYFTEQLEIDFNAPLHEADTQAIHLNDTVLYHVEFNVDSIYFSTDVFDSLKSIQITLLDSNYSEVTINHDIPDFSTIPNSENFCLTALLEFGNSTIDKQVLVGKTTGIQEIPNLAFYPYCRSFEKYITVDSLKTILEQPIFEVGDRIDEVRKSLSASVPENITEETKMEIGIVHVNTFDKTIDYLGQYWKKIINISPATGDTTITESFDPNYLFSAPYIYDDYLFNGLTQNKPGERYFIRMNSVWNKPLLQDPFGYVDGNTLNINARFPQISEMISFNSGLTVEQLSKCVTYFNIGGDTYGDPHAFSVEEADKETLQVVISHNQLMFNQAVTGNVVIYSMDGKLITGYNNLDQVNTLELPNLMSGIYLISLQDMNTVLKVSVN